MTSLCHCLPRTLVRNKFLNHQLLRIRNSNCLSSWVPPRGLPDLYRCKNPPEDIWADKKDPKYTDVEEVHGHWHYVERLFPKLVIPSPPKNISTLLWKSPPEVAPDLQYFVQRTRNHMLPVFKARVYDERLLVTTVTKVQGDIWVFEHDLKTYLQKKHNCNIESHVNEIGCFVNVGGDYIQDIKEWLYNNGF